MSKTPEQAALDDHGTATALILIEQAQRALIAAARILATRRRLAEQACTLSRACENLYDDLSDAATGIPPRHCTSCGAELGHEWDRATVHIDRENGITCGGKIVE